ncbi:hypothetical protein HFO38_29305 [Rhizobium leguminosarum]|uniref:hypothetical protein n=1 Tax=Rhizobium leguminosarum TaxID=384 RepID=UPI001C9377F9|nr:hypothetical protein [Rhizobium leguminosarum]MBY5706769.1 hypothetical protein [Rhizobium leguminosarum]
MGEIRYLANRDLSKHDILDRIVAEARSNAGLWLMVKERAMEMRALKSELGRLGGDASDMGRSFPARLTPTIAELTEELLSTIFGSCPPDMLPRAQAALLLAAESELDADTARPT